MYRRYYEEPAVQARIRDFLGGAPPTCRYLLVREEGSAEARRIPPEGLEGALARSSEIERSLWDREALIAHLDLEYVNFDVPLAPYLDPARSFALQAPVVRAIQQVLLEHGLAPLHLLSGRGHHFSWKIARESVAWARLAELGRGWPSEELLEQYRRPQGPGGERVGEDWGRAYAGLGLVMEWVGHRILARAAGQCRVPLMATAVEVGPGDRGREVISLDLSEYGDPLHERTVRVPFGAYRKTDALAGWEVKGALPPLVLLPLHEMGEGEGLLAMRNLERAAELASRVPTALPDLSAAMGGLIEGYEASPLRVFHLDYLSRGRPEPPEPPEGALPRCVTELLERPNDRLLKPAGMQLVVRALLALGYAPREAGELILRRFREDHGWRAGVHFDEPHVRAHFYTRLFSGLIRSGLDRLIDFNCRSNQEKGYCPVRECSFNLAVLRERLAPRGGPARIAPAPVVSAPMASAPIAGT